MLATFTKRAPGLGAAVATAAGGVAVATQMPESLHISGIPCSLVLGAVANNGLPNASFGTSWSLRPDQSSLGRRKLLAPRRRDRLGYDELARRGFPR